MEEAIDSEKLIAWLLENIFASPKMKRELPGDKLAVDTITYEDENMGRQKRFKFTYGGSYGEKNESFNIPDGIKPASYLEYICATLDTHLKSTLINPDCKVKSTFKTNPDKKGSERITITFNYV
jgi:hypothetical protein